MLLDFASSHSFCHVLTKAWPHPCLAHLSALLWFAAVALGDVCQFTAGSGFSLAYTYLLQIHTDPFISLVRSATSGSPLFSVCVLFCFWIGAKMLNNTVKEWQDVKKTVLSVLNSIPLPSNLAPYHVPNPAPQVWPCLLPTTSQRRMTSAHLSAPWHLTMASCRVRMCRRGAREDAHAAWTRRTRSTDRLWAWALSHSPMVVVLVKQWVCASTGTSITLDVTQEIVTLTKVPSTLTTLSTPGS